MGHHEDRDLLVAHEVQQQAQDLAPDGGVEARHRLVGDEQPGIHHHRPGDDDPLALPPGELVGVAEEEALRRTQAAASERLRDAGALVPRPWMRGPSATIS